jgi:hypothetical protein
MSATSLPESLALQTPAQHAATAAEPPCASHEAPLFLGYPAGALQHAGEAHGALVQQVLALRREAAGDPVRLLSDALQLAGAAGSLGPRDLPVLLAIAPAAAMTDAAERLSLCRSVQQRLMRQGAAPLALHIAAIASDSAAAAMLQKLPVGEDILGAVIGGVVGFAFGNPLVGAIVGAVLLSSAEFNPLG